jgi:hypothetical protein
LDLNSLLTCLKNGFLVDHTHNSEILNYFDQEPMSGKSLQLRYTRSPDFFKYLSFQANDYFVFARRNAKQKIDCLGTLHLRPGYINGKVESVGYLGDLRITPTKENVKEWRFFLSHLVNKASEVDEFKGTRHFVMAIIDDNYLAQRALIRSTKNSFTCEPIAKYEMVNILGRKPWRFGLKSKNNLVTRLATASDVSSLEMFLERESKKIPFGYVFKNGELSRRLKAWPGLSVRSFVIVEKENTILGCAALWSPSPFKKIIVEKLPWRLKLFRKLLPFPKERNELKLSYVTHLQIATELNSVSKGEVVESLFESLWQKKSEPLMAFCDFKSNSLSPFLKRYFLQKVPMTLYSVRGLNTPELGLSDLKNGLAGFEMALH